MLRFYRFNKNYEGISKLKEIKPNDIFYIKHQWFRDLCFYRGFEYSLFHPFLNWLDNKYNRYLDSKTFYIISRKKSTLQSDAEWILHKRYFYRYVDGVFKEKERMWSRTLTNLMLHFDEGREVYEIQDEEEINKFLYMKELVS